MTEFKAHFKSVQPDLGGSLPGRLIFGIPGKDGGYYLVAAEQVDANTIRFTFTPSQKEMPKVDPVDIELPGATDERIEEAIKEYLQNNPAIGKPGKDGFSPIAKVVQTDDGAVITITDKDGTTEVVITNGKNGYTPKKGIDYDDGKSAYEYAKEGGYTGTETEFSEKLAKEYPEKVSQLENDSQYINAAGAPVQSINGKTGKVQLGAADVGARPFNWMPTAAEVGALPDTYVPPNQTAAQVGADPAGTAAAAVSAHNTSTDAHNDLRLELKAINDRLTAFFDSDNQTLDELSEIVAYITSNKALIDSITTSKVSVTDIINNLTSNVANKPLSAAQGVALKGLIDAVSNSLSNYQPKGDYALRSELPTVPTKVSQLQNDKGYLTEHQDISGKLDADKLPEAVNAALAQAKDSGEFDGDPGAPGVTPHIGANGNWYIGSADTGVKAQGKDGTSVTVKSVSESTADGGSNVVTFSDGKTLNVKNGKAGTPGKTPVRGVDYYTEADKAEIVAMVIESLGGNPIFGIVDENNNIVVSGNLPDGTYSVKYEMENGSKVNIGNLVIDTNVYYTVKNTLTNCTSNNSATQAVQGGSYSATISAKSGYELKSIVVKMGGTDISSTAVSGGTITIAHVTGNIVITAVAEEVKAVYTNLIPTLTDVDLTTIYNGVGYKENTRISVSAVSSSNPTGEKAAEGATLLGLCPIGADGDVFHFRGIDGVESESDYSQAFWCYDATGTLLNTKVLSIPASTIGTDENGDHTVTMTRSKWTNLISGAVYIRFNVGVVTGDLIMTRNQLIPKA